MRDYPSHLNRLKEAASKGVDAIRDIYLLLFCLLNCECRRQNLLIRIFSDMWPAPSLGTSLAHVYLEMG